MDWFAFDWVEDSRTQRSLQERKQLAAVVEEDAVVVAAAAVEPLGQAFEACEV